MKPGKPATATTWHGGQPPVDDLLTDIRSVIERATYGKQIVSTLSRQLSIDYGRSLGSNNLRHMMRFAEVFPEENIVYALSRQLSWPHFRAVGGDGWQEKAA